ESNTCSSRCSSERRLAGLAQLSRSGAGGSEPNRLQHLTQGDGAEIAPLVAAGLRRLTVMGNEEDEVSRPHHLHSRERYRQRAELAELHRLVTAPDARVLLV